MNESLGYFVGGLFDGAALVYFITGLQMKRAVRRRAKEISDIIEGAASK